jgi:hypothetical protein
MITKDEKQDLIEAGEGEGYEATRYAEVTDTDFDEVGVEGEDEDDLKLLSYEDAVAVVANAAWEGEQNSRQYSGHSTYEITRIFGARDRDEWDLEEAYEHYEEGVSRGIDRGVRERLGPKSKWRKQLGSNFGALVPQGVYTLSFQVETEADPSSLLDKMEEIAEGFTDDDYGTEVEPIEGSPCVQESGGDRYTLSFQVETEADPSNLLDKLHEIAEGFTDDDYGTSVEPIMKTTEVSRRLLC